MAVACDVQAAAAGCKRHNGGGRDSDASGNSDGGAGQGQDTGATAAEVVPVGSEVGIAQSSLDNAAAVAAAAAPDVQGQEAMWLESDGVLGCSTDASVGDAGQQQDGLSPLMPGSLLLGSRAELDQRFSWSGRRPFATASQRVSEASGQLQHQHQQQPSLRLRGQGPGSAAEGRLAGQQHRNSDAGSYFNSARLAEAPPRGASPVRHSLLVSPLMRQLEAREAGKAAQHPPESLEYVPRPKLRAQPSSRGGMLLSQPSMRHYPPGSTADAAPGAPCTARGPEAQRSELSPTKAISRSRSAATPLRPSTSATASPMQLLSPTSVGGGPGASLATLNSTPFSGAGADAATSRATSGRTILRQAHDVRIEMASAASHVALGAIEVAAGAPMPQPPLASPRDPSSAAPTVTDPRVACCEPDEPLALDALRTSRASEPSLPLAMRRTLASMDGATRHARHSGGGGGGGGQLPSAAWKPLPASGATGGYPAGSRHSSKSQLRLAFRGVAWSDIEPSAVAAAPPTAQAAATATAVSVDTSGAGGRTRHGRSNSQVLPAAVAASRDTNANNADTSARLAGRTSRLMASLQRLGVAPPDAPVAPAAAAPSPMAA